MRNTRILIFSTVLTIAAVGQVVSSFLLYANDGSPVVRNVGWGVLWISAIFGWLPIFTFKKWGRIPKGKSYVHTTTLVDRGVYAVVRHPQYLAGMMMGLALAMIAQHWIVAVLGAIAITIYYVNTFEEENSAIEKFGDDYKRYMRSVPRINFVAGFVRLLHGRGRN